MISLPIAPNVPAEIAAVAQRATEHWPIVTEIGGMQMAELPGGLFVQGSPAFTNTPSHWTGLSPFSIGTESVTEDAYRDAVGHPGLRDAAEEDSVTWVSWMDARKFMTSFKRNGGLFSRLVDLPTEAQWEFAMKGPPKDLRKEMERVLGVYRPGDVADFVTGRMENLFVELGGDIFNDPKGDAFQRLVASGRKIFGWDVLGSENLYRIKRPETGVLEWVRDMYGPYPEGPVLDPGGSDKGEARVIRGGQGDKPGQGLHPARRRGYPANNGFNNVSFRVALSTAKSSQSIVGGSDSGGGIVIPFRPRRDRGGRVRPVGIPMIS